MEPTPDNHTKPTRSRLRRLIGALCYEQWLVVVFVCLLCTMVGLEIADNKGLIRLQGGSLASGLFPAVTYTDLCPLVKDGFWSLTGKQVERRIYDEYHIAPIQSSPDISTSYYTFHAGRTLRFLDLRDDHPLVFSQQEIENGPRLGQVVAGLGAPEWVYHYNYVTIAQEFTLVAIVLDYPKSGISVATGQVYQGNRQNADAELTNNLKVRSIYCYEPRSSMEQVLRDVYHYQPDAVEQQMQRRTPWPGFGTWLP